ncbi:MAG TPA: YIP1 family protein [Candidatus Angelobacter sp.]|nr:YIP1 family protein [Candidatus Angelobacter sp.]
MSSPTSPTQQPTPYPPAVTPEPAGPGLSEPQRLINVFFDPKKTFTDIKRNPSWWVPWLLASIFALVPGILVVQKVDLHRFMEQQIERSPAAQRRLENLTPEQRAKGIDINVGFIKGTIYAYPVLNLVKGLIIAAILMVVFNFFLAAEVPFQRAMAVVFYSYIPFIVYSVLLTVSLLVASDPNSIEIGNPMPTNPAFFMDPTGNRFLYSIAASLDIFNIWTVVLFGLGFSAASNNRKPDTGTGITTMFVVYGVLILCTLGWKAVF